jgi:hypothetical protein
MTAALKSCFRNSTGNVAIITALTLAMVIGIGGSAYDLAAYSESQTRYSAAADASALAAVSFASDRSQDGTMSEEDIEEASEDYALATWATNLGSDEDAEQAPATVKMQSGTKGWTSRIDYSAGFATTFLAIIGIKNLTINGHSTASADLGTVKWEFNFLIDTSSSMGLGATDAEMKAMLDHKQIGCEFACHRDMSAPYANTIDIAHAAGIRLRVDVVDQAVDSVIDELSAKNNDDDGLFKASLFGMDDDIKELVPLNANLNKVKNHVIKLNEATGSRGDTNYRVAMEKITSKINGNKDKARKVLFIVTDGVHDAPQWESNVVTVYNANHKLGPMDPTWCTGLKAAGVQVGVLHVNYKVPSRAPFPKFVKDYESQIIPTLRDCASDGLFFSADTPQGITDGMKAMLDKALEANVRLTE